MRPLTHIVAIVLGIAAPWLFTLWSTTDYGPRSAAHYARAAAMDERPVAVLGRFTDLALGENDPQAAAERFFAADLQEHGLPDGAEGGAERLLARGWGNAGQERRVLNTVANNELAVLQQLVFPPEGGRPHSEIDIFRMADGMIVEHWEVIQTHGTEVTGAASGEDQPE